MEGLLLGAINTQGSSGVAESGADRNSFYLFLRIDLEKSTPQKEGWKVCLDPYLVKSSADDFYFGRKAVFIASFISSDTTHRIRKLMPLAFFH
ncbi:hypothetical protein CEXT_168671 [Caerostris extrusa]|uniref:Uncharacterized protein n=1 Tax=Caerostris extrusa TaxID=172846 RepID=A0AAV4MCZ2_CAEEX|nr:hypothetical protein CEXT_168671 [Caerostris extrusa]